MISDATYRLPDGHSSAGAFATQAEARQVGNFLIQRARKGVTYYLMDKRGAWEIIRVS